MEKIYKELRDDNSDMRNGLTTLKDLPLNALPRLLPKLVAISLPN
jgi:hypothetical protein